VVHGLSKVPASVTVDGTQAQPSFDAAHRLAVFAMPATSKEIRIAR